MGRLLWSPRSCVLTTEGSAVTVHVRHTGATMTTDSEVRSVRSTQRETQILTLISAGLCDKEVAARLGVSARTVRTHLERFFLRNGVHSRTEAVSLWLQHSLRGDPW